VSRGRIVDSTVSVVIEKGARPERALTWRDYPTDATRWQFDG